MVRTTVHTPRLKGLLFNAGDFDLLLGALRPFRTSWFTVGILFSCCIFLAFRGGAAAKQATKNPVAHPHGGVQIGSLVTNLSSPNSKPPNGSSETQRPDDTKYTQPNPTSVNPPFACLLKTIIAKTRNFHKINHFL
jgi:hypothetical protein